MSHKHISVNIRSKNIVQQEGGVGCANQAQDEGDKQASFGNDQSEAADQGDQQPVTNIDQSETGGESSEGDQQDTVNADQSNDCGLEQAQTIVQNADTADHGSNQSVE